MTEPSAKRHAEYKVGGPAGPAGERGRRRRRTPAIDALKKFKGKHPDSWQIGSALQLLGRLQLDTKDYAGARETLRELAQANVAEDVKQEAQLQVIQVPIRARQDRRGRASGSTSFIKTLPKESKHAVEARVVQAELLIAAKKYDEAIKLLRQVNKETTDRRPQGGRRTTRWACASSSARTQGGPLGVPLGGRGLQPGQDTSTPRRSITCGRSSSKLGDAERPQECREMLLSDRAFAGSEWRSRAQKEIKAQ